MLDVLFIALDDLSQRELSAYESVWEGEKIATPHLDAFAEEAVTFAHVSSMPLCSPTRASLLTGLYPFRVGIGNAITQGETGLDPDTPTLADWFGDAGYATALFGKWHLSDANPGLSGPPHPWDHPGAMGFDTWRACKSVGLGNGDGYYDWKRVDDGLASVEATYSTTAIADAFLEWESTAQSPWFAFVSFNAPHGPYQDPPPELLPPGWPTPASDRDRFVASVMAADTEIGRVLAAAPRSTVVVLLGDNGTAKAVKHPLQQADQVKGSLHVEGVEVPFFVRNGGGGPPGSFNATTVASVVDIAPTVLSIVGIPVPCGLDGLPGGRLPVYAERFAPQGFGPFELDLQSARGLRFKLRRETGVELLFDLESDPEEQVNLLEGGPLTSAAAAAYADLSVFLDQVRNG